MTFVSDHMDITWICKFCGAVNTVSDSVCTECHARYVSGSPRQSRESVTNQAMLNNGVIFHNAVFAPQPQPQPSMDDMIQSIEAVYPQVKETDADVKAEPTQSFGMVLFTWTCNILMWVAILTFSSVLLFFVWVLFKAFS